MRVSGALISAILRERFLCLEKSSIYLENTFVCFFAPLARTFRRTKKSSAIGGRGAGGAAFERGKIILNCLVVVPIE